MHKARLLEELDESLIEKVLENESSKSISKIFSYLDTNDQATIIGMFAEKRQSEILTAIEADDKEEVEEIVEFLKDPKKFSRLGGKIPRGCLLVGPP